MINITDKSQCCGCSACSQICPKKCITMKVDDEGFEYPLVNSSQCVECGLCKNSCPILNKYSRKNNLLESYIAYANENNIRLKSSSGGIFSLLAEEILNKDGIIFGAAFNDDFLVHHVLIDNLENLYKLRGSKYIQSRIEDTFMKAKQFLEQGRYVLFSGTSCQIAGLKKYLAKDYEKLYTVGVLCHGAPSPKVWEEYKKYQIQQGNSQINKIEFRNKETGWKQYSVKINFYNHNKYKQIFKNDYFMRLFLSDICLRPSCYDCKFKDLNRPSDITLGDCWGIENYMPDMDDDKGTSVVLVHSKQGQELFNNIKDRIKYCKAEVDKALPPTADSRKSVTKHPKRDKFFEMLQDGNDIEELIKLLEPGVCTKVKRKIKRIIKKLIILPN